MNIRLLSLLVLPLLVAVAALTVSASETNAQPPTTRTVVAVLRGSEEVPVLGDPDGIGGANIVLNAAEGEVCASIGAAFIQPATVAHIHRGARGVPGPVVVDFTSLIIPGISFTGTSVIRGCVDANPTLIAEIIANPSGFYVNVHNAEFMGGAVRGQLR
jgi:hypothetical protein